MSSSNIEEECNHLASQIAIVMEKDKLIYNEVMVGTEPKVVDSFLKNVKENYKGTVDSESKIVYIEKVSSYFFSLFKSSSTNGSI